MSPRDKWTMRALRILVGIVVLGWLGAVADVAVAAPGPFAECDERFRSRPGDEEASRCYSEVASRQGLRQEAARLLEVRVGEHPDQPWPRYYLGRLSNGPKAFDSLRQARDVFLNEDNTAAAFSAQVELVKKLDRAGDRLEEAEKELARARAMLPLEGDDGDGEDGWPDDLAAVERIYLAEAMLATNRGDLDGALATLVEIKDRVIPGGPDEFREELLYRLGFLYYRLGRWREAGEAFERSADISRGQGNRYREAATLSFAANIFAAQAGEEDREEATARYRKVLTAAESADRRSIMAKVHLELAKLVARPEEVRHHVDRCLAFDEVLDPETRVGCHGVRALAWVRDDPSEARRLLDRAIEIAEQAKVAGAPWAAIHLWKERLPVSWATVPRGQAIRESLATLEDIEEVSDTLLDESAGAQFFSVWAAAHQWLAGKLLETSGPPVQRADLEQAFEVSERYRARVLLERLREFGAWPDLSEQRQEEVRARPVATLGEVEQVLSRDEAMLVFQVAEWRDLYGRFAGGSWLFVVTEGGSRVYRLDRGGDLEERVKEFLSSPSSQRRVVAEGLYRDLLLDRVLGELPAEVDKLLIVPDGSLHRVPFGALGLGDGKPLADRFEISRLPSAGPWLRWRAAETEAGPALVLADPERPAPETIGSESTPRSEAFTNGLRWCRRLPYAREEGEAIRRRAGRSSVLRVGEEASESFLKRTDLAPFGVIHLASHAYVDPRQAERSLVCLAAGSDEEDGNLEVREIVNLELGGQLVVLASCKSASGPQLAGEGVMSLARAFFLAGARTVVASLQDLDDEEAKDLFVRFHSHLAKGLSVSGALRAAKREIFEQAGGAGARANSAWTNVVVLGDGSHKPLLAEPIILGQSWWWWVVAALVIYLISIGIRLWLQRR